MKRRIAPCNPCQPRLLRLLVCFVGLPMFAALPQLAWQFYITYGVHDQLFVNWAAVLGTAILGFCPAFAVYLLWIVMAWVMSEPS